MALSLMAISCSWPWPSGWRGGVPLVKTHWVNIHFMAGWTQVVSVPTGHEGKKKKVTSSFSGEQLSLCHPQLLFSPKPLNPGCAVCCPALDAHCHDKWAQAPFNYAQSAKMQETMETGLCSASADPRHSSQQFSLISINSCPIHHTPQET